MDIPARPEIKVPLRRRVIYSIVEWSNRNRKWLPHWTQILMLKMVRRRIGIERMTVLRDTALKQLSKEQIQRARESLREDGLL